MKPGDLTRTFRTKVTVCDCEGCTQYERGPCWVFARVDRYGYGQFKRNNKNLIAHRFAYERLVGPIDDGMTIDHLCDRHRNCVNPEHMEQVTLTENSVRANARRWQTKEQDNE